MKMSLKKSLKMSLKKFLKKGLKKFDLFFHSCDFFENQNRLCHFLAQFQNGDC